MATLKHVTIHHSPDADDAFMFHGLASGAVSIPGYTFDLAKLDIESLNHRARDGVLDCTAVSVHAYPSLSDRYAVTTVGASMGGSDYGPRLVALERFELAERAGLRIGIPGTLTSAALALRLHLHERAIDATLVPLHFDAVHEEVRKGTVDCGVIIHEGQITLSREGFRTILDLGAWWWEKTGLPLPLGVNVVNRSLGAEAMRATAEALYRSIKYGLDNRKEALAYAMGYGRGLSEADADQFVGMYVNYRTLDIGEQGMASIRLFLQSGVDAGIIERMPPLDFVDWRPEVGAEAGRFELEETA